MKKILYNSNLYMLLLLPVFLLAITGIFYRTYQLELPNMQSQLIGMFNNRTVFQVLCEVIVSQIQ
ncbi:MAG: hypothetical protein EOP42_14850 [Sphingobacteriaceae bacterium]|nr:MAG: hypothetical protein EOP42_14850 [Sphingobacteriaceae bacterium]